MNEQEFSELYTKYEAVKSEFDDVTQDLADLDFCAWLISTEEIMREQMGRIKLLEKKVALLQSKIGSKDFTPDPE